MNCNSSVFCDKIQTKDFSVYVRNGDWGLQLKMGMEKELVNSPDWYSLDLGAIENKETSSMDFKVLDIRKEERDNLRSLICDLRHRLLPLDVSVCFSAFGETGTITRKVEFKNTGKYPIHLENIQYGIKINNEYPFFGCDVLQGFL